MTAMKKPKLNLIILTILILVLTAAIVIAIAIASRPAPQTGDSSDGALNTAPDFSFVDPEGNTVKLSDYFGKPIVLNFWATWCPPCKAELPAFDEAYKKYGDDVIFIMLNLPSDPSELNGGAQKFMDELGFDLPVSSDAFNSGSQTYGISSIPRSVFIDKNGALTDSHNGRIDYDTLVRYIDKITD